MLNMKISEIKTYSNRIFDAVLRLLPQLGADTSAFTKRYFKSLLNSRQTHFFIAEVNDQIAGMLTIGTYDIPSGTKMWIEDVVVDISHRGKGIGKELTLFALEYARSLGAKSIELTSRPSRIEANRLYQKLGFELRETNVYQHNLL